MAARAGKASEVGEGVERAAARNEVLLVGRVSGAPEERELPSGDALVSWRVVVARPAPRRAPPPGVRTPTIDTVDCVAWAGPVRRTARGLADGDIVAIEGALRWRAGAAAASRTEVEVEALRRVGRRTR